MISVIVPVYKVEKYLSRCIESILNQTFTDFELILVDDGSPDQSGVICDSYAKKDNRIHVIHKENGGLSSARNAGIEAAQGEYVFFVDSDDIIHEQSLEILYREIQSKHADIVMGLISRFSDELELKKSILREYECKSYSNIELLNLFFEDSIPIFNLISACGKLIKKEFFDNIRFPIGRLFEDEFTTYRLYYEASNIVVININMYYYFVNASGITQNLSLEKRFDEYDAQDERIKFFKEKQLNNLYQKALLEFLRTAQWDLINCKNGKEKVDNVKKKLFIKQYTRAFEEAKKEKVLEFIKHYDYYVLARPQFVLYYRIKRLVLTWIVGK